MRRIITLALLALAISAVTTIQALPTNTAISHADVMQAATSRDSMTKAMQPKIQLRWPGCIRRMLCSYRQQVHRSMVGKPSDRSMPDGLPPGLAIMRSK